MARVMLINPVIREWSNPNVPPLGMMYLSSVLRAAGHYVEIFDINGKRPSNEEIEEHIANSQFDIYGTGGIVTTYAYCAWLSEIIKKHHPEACVVWGGPVTTSSRKLLVGQPNIDCLVVGEGEYLIPGLINDLKEGNLKKVYSGPVIEGIDNLPFPDFDNLDTLPIYLNAAVGGLNVRKWIDGERVVKVKSYSIISARGCPFNCNFCYSKYLGQGYRSRSVESVVDEMFFLQDTYGVQYVQLSDELSLTTERGYALAAEISKRKLKILWGVNTRVDILNREILLAMRDVGLIHLGTGIESFDSGVRKAMNKPINVEKTIKNMILAKQIIRSAQYTLIIGYPGETEKSIAVTYQGIKDLGFPPEQAFFATAYPGTALYDYAVNAGYIKNEFEYLNRLSGNEQGSGLLVNFTDLPDEVLLETKAAFESYPDQYRSKKGDLRVERGNFIQRVKENLRS